MTVEETQSVLFVVGSLLGSASVGVLTWAAKPLVGEIRSLVEKVARQYARINALAVELGALLRWRDEFAVGLPIQVRQADELELLRMTQAGAGDSRWLSPTSSGSTLTASICLCLPAARVGRFVGRHGDYPISILRLLFWGQGHSVERSMRVVRRVTH